VETAFGLHTATFPTPHGVVRVNLPDDLTAGDTISGTVFEEPAGTSETERTRNEDELSGYVVELEKQPSPVDKEQPRWTVPAAVAAAVVPLVLRDKQGREVGRVSVPLQGTTALPAAPAKPSSGEFELPTVAQAGKPVEVRGPFDGRAAETAVTVAGRAARVLAESPRKAVVQTPPGAVGAVDIEVSKGGRKARCTFRSLGVRLSAPKTSLLKGEQTTMTVAVSGLAGIKDPVSLVLTNRTPTAVSLGGGDRQELSIPTSAVAADGTFVGTRTLTGLRSGGFSVNAAVRDAATARQACDMPIDDAPLQPWTARPPVAGGTSPGEARVERLTRAERVGEPAPPTEEEVARSRTQEVAYACPVVGISTARGGQPVNGILFQRLLLRVGPRSCSLDFNPPFIPSGVQHTVYGVGSARADYVVPRVTRCEAWDETWAGPGFPPHSFSARIAVPSQTRTGEAEVFYGGTVTEDGRNVRLNVRWARPYPGDTGTARDNSSQSCALYEH